MKNTKKLILLIFVIVAFVASVVILGAILFEIIEKHTGFLLTESSDTERLARHHKKQKQKVSILLKL